MAKSVRDHLLDALENLEAQELKRVKGKLNELPVRPGYDNIPRGRLEHADAQDLSHLLVRYYAEDYAMQVTAEALEAANCKGQAEKLREVTGTVHREETEDSSSLFNLSALNPAVFQDLLDIVMDRPPPKRSLSPSHPPSEEDSRTPSQAAGVQLQPPLPGQCGPDNEDRSTSMNPKVFSGTSLKWVKFQGSLPEGAVHYPNAYANREEYPSCVSSGHIGHYSKERGPYCFYPFGGAEEKSSEFWVLVNENNREQLHWEQVWLGNVPTNAVSTCSGDRFFVGRSKHGIGKIDRDCRNFFIAVNGEEHFYPVSQVLVIKRRSSN